MNLVKKRGKQLKEKQIKLNGKAEAISKISNTQLLSTMVEIWHYRCGAYERMEDYKELQEEYILYFEEANIRMARKVNRMNLEKEIQEVIDRNINALDMDLGLCSTREEEKKILEKYKYYIDSEINRTMKQHDQRILREFVEWLGKEHGCWHEMTLEQFMKERSK